MKYKESLVSILMPVCNAENFIKETLESIFKQTYQNFEIIALDDASKDNSYQILKEFSRKDKRLKVYKNIKRYGLAVSLNRLAKIASGQFVAFMNAQDISSLHRLKRQVTYLTTYQKDVVAVGTQSTFIDEKNRRTRRSSFPTEFEELYKSLVSGRALQFESFMINRRFLPKDILKFPLAKYPFVFHALIIRLIKYGKIANLNQHLYFHRVLDISASAQGKKIKHALNHLSFWFKSITVYDYRPSAKSIIDPLISPVKNILN